MTPLLSDAETYPAEIAENKKNALNALSVLPHRERLNVILTAIAMILNELRENGKSYQPLVQILVLLQQTIAHLSKSESKSTKVIPVNT